MSGVDEAADRRRLREIVRALYDSVSAPAGVTPPIEDERPLLHPQARKVRTVYDTDGRPTRQIMSGTEYAENVRSLVTEVGFFEVETAHEAFVYGNIAHVVSHYDGYADAEHTRLVKRGVNSIQFVRVRGAWKVLSMLWDDEENRIVPPTDATPVD